LIAGGAFGCSDEPQVGAMIIEVASEVPSCAPETETPAPVMAFACALVSICEREPGSPTCTGVPAVTAEQYGQAGMGPLGNSVLVPINASGDFDFQMQLHGEGVEDPGFERRFLEVTTELYDASGAAVYRGIRTGVRVEEFFAAPLHMRVYPFARTACAGPNPEGGLERRLKDRAFHAATRLPNGDVLIYGGVRGEAAINDLGTSSVGAPPQPVVELYRVQEDRIVEVGGESFSRVLFGSVVLTEDPDAEQFRVYVSGGFTELGTLLRFDVNQNRPENFYGTPLLVGENATAEPDVILTYDRAENTLTVTEVDPEAFGAVAADDDPNMPHLPVVGGVTDSALGMGMPWSFVSNNRWISRADGREDMSGTTMRSAGNTERFGHSTTLLPSGQAFVWGGNMTTTDGSALETTAGQIIRQTGMTTDATSPGMGAPAPTAFHTATPIGMSEVLLIGGLQTSCLGTIAPCGQNGITVFPAVNPVVRLRVAPTGITDVFPYAAQPFDNSIFHAATRLDDDSLMMTGGSECNVPAMSTTGCALLSSLTETSRIFTVNRDRGAFNDPDDDLPDTLLQGRFGHRVTRLDSCPAGATDCSDPRYLVTGGFVRLVGGAAEAIEATRVAEVILKQRTGAYGTLSFDENCVLSGAPDGGTDAALDTSPPDTGSPDTLPMMDSGMGDGGPTDGAVDGG